MLHKPIFLFFKMNDGGGGDRRDEDNRLTSFQVTSNIEPACTISLGNFCEVHGPTIIFSTQVYPLASLRLSKEPTQVPQKRVCPMCESIPDDTGFITADESTGTAFISKRTPSMLKDAIQQACVRSLCCEWVPQEVVSFTPQGMGRARSVSVTETDKASRSFLSPEFTHRTETKRTTPIIPIMHGCKQNGYTLSLEFKVEDNKARGSARWYVVNITWMGNPAYLGAVSCFQVAESIIGPFIREIQDRAMTFKVREFEYERNRSLNGTRPGNDDNSFMDSKRSLARIVDTTPYDLFEYVHKTFCKVSLSLSKDFFYPAMRRSPQFSLTSRKEPPSSSEYLETEKGFDLIRLFSNLSTTDAKILLYNCFAGNQVIVRGDWEAEVRGAVCKIACALLPHDLRGEICEYSCTYKSFYEARFLGVPLSAEIPNPKEMYTVLDAFEEGFLGDPPGTENEEVDTGDRYAGRAVLTLDTDMSKCSVEGVYFQTSIVDDMLASLKSSTVEHRIALIHDRWMTAAKLGYALQNQGLFDNESDINSVLPLLNIQKTDLDILKYWMCCIRKNFFRPRPKEDI